MLKEKKESFPAQHQSRQPGLEFLMKPEPVYDNPRYEGSGKLLNKTAIITGGDSGIGRAVSLAFAKEGANLVLAYLNEEIDAEKTKEEAELYGVTCTLLKGDIRERSFCEMIVNAVVDRYGSIDLLVNNTAVQFPQENLEDISDDQWDNTFKTNIYSMFYITRAALRYMKKGSAIINSSSVTAYRGSSHLIDYSATKGAIVSFTRSLALNLSEKGIRVNAVAPGPIWTPLIPSSFSANYVKKFGQDVPLGRAGQPYEVAPAYVFLASEDASYITGQVIHPNGGEIINT